MPTLHRGKYSEPRITQLLSPGIWEAVKRFLARRTTISLPHKHARWLKIRRINVHFSFLREGRARLLVIPLYFVIPRLDVDLPIRICLPDVVFGKKMILIDEILAVRDIETCDGLIPLASGLHVVGRNVNFVTIGIPIRIKHFVCMLEYWLRDCLRRAELRSILATVENVKILLQVMVAPLKLLLHFVFGKRIVPQIRVCPRQWQHDHALIRQHLY